MIAFIIVNSHCFTIVIALFSLSLRPSFYTTITNDHIGVEVGGGGEPRKWQVLPRIEVDTTRRSHLRLIWALNVINSSQFDDQAFWPVVWWFPAGWVLVHSHYCHLKTTQALEHIRQAWETSPRKSRPGKQWQWYTHGLLVHWCRNRVGWKVSLAIVCVEAGFCQIQSQLCLSIGAC